MTVLLVFGVSAALGVWCWWRANARLLGDAFSPLMLLFFGWVLPLATTSLHLSRLQHPWHLFVQLSVVWITFALVASSAAAAFRLSASDALSPDKGSDFVAQLGSPGLLRVVLLFYVIGFAGYVYNEFITNPVGIPLFALLKDPTLERVAYHRWGKEGGATLGGLMTTFVPLLIPVLYWIAAVQPKGRQRRLILLCIVAYPVMAVLKMSRVDVVTTGILLCGAEYYRRRLLAASIARQPHARRSWRLLVVCVLALVAIVPLAQNFLELRSGIADLADLYVGKLEYSVDVPPALQSLVNESYSYFALPFENFADWVRNFDGPSIFGAGVLRPVASVLGMGRDIDDKFMYVIGDYRFFPINTFPFVTTSYFEYGYLSIVVVPVYYAFVVNGLYVRFRRKPTVLRAGLYLNCLSAWMFLFAGAGLSVLTFYINIAILSAVVLAGSVLDGLREPRRPTQAVVLASD